MEESAGDSTNISGNFSEFFRKENKAIQNQIDHVGDVATAGGERFYALDHCSAGIARLSQELQNVAALLPAYDHKTYVEAIKTLSDRLTKTRAIVAPRPRFQFKSRLTELGTTVKATITPSTNASLQSSRNNLFSGNAVPRDILEDQRQDNDKEDLRAHVDAKREKSLLQISDLSNEYVFRSTLDTDSNASIPDQAEISTIQQSVVVWHPGEANDLINKDVKDTNSISTSAKDHDLHTQADPNNFVHSTNAESKTEKAATTAISLSPSLKSLRLRNIHRSLIIFAHPIAGAVYVSDVHGSVIALTGCRQLRMHGCKDVKVYVESTTGPVVEDCVGVGFARWPTVLANTTSIADTNSNAYAKTWTHHVVDFSNPGAIHSSALHPQSEPETSTSPSSSSSSNWYIIQPDERIMDGTWRQVIAAAEGNDDDERPSAEEILKLCWR